MADGVVVQGRLSLARERPAALFGGLVSFGLSVKRPV